MYHIQKEKDVSSPFPSLHDLMGVLHMFQQDMYNGMAEAFVHTQGRRSEALEAYKQTLLLNPINQTAWLGRGNVFYELSKSLLRAFSVGSLWIFSTPDSSLRCSFTRIDACKSNFTQGTPSTLFLFTCLIRFV